MLPPRVANLRPTAVNSILSEVREVQSRGVKVTSLMRGEPDLPTPAHIVEAAVAALGRGRTGYPDNRGEMALREAVAEKLRRDNGLTYDPAKEILVTTGATFGIHAALTAILDEGDEVLMPEPIYDAYQSPIRMAGGVPRTAPSWIANGRFSLFADDLDAACTDRTRVLLLNTPWNPTGTVFNEEELRAICEVADRRGLYLISDEIYETIVYDGHRHISPASVMPELRDRTILINSLSKTYAMTGWRVGYCAAPAKLIEPMFLVLQQSSRGPATFIQDAAAAALKGSQQCVADMQAEYARRRTLVSETLAGTVGCDVLSPQGGFFSMLDVRANGLPSDDVRRRLLNEFGVVVAHGSAYGPSGEGTLRVAFASGGVNLATGLEKLRLGLTRIYEERAGQ